MNARNRSWNLSIASLGVKRRDEVEKQSCFVRLTAQQPLGESVELFPFKVDAALSPRKSSAVTECGLFIVVQRVSNWLQVVKGLKTCLVCCDFDELVFSWTSEGIGANPTDQGPEGNEGKQSNKLT